MGAVADAIEHKIRHALAPTTLVITDDSAKHGADFFAVAVTFDYTVVAVPFAARVPHVVVVLVFFVSVLLAPAMRWGVIRRIGERARYESQ